MVRQDILYPLIASQLSVKHQTNQLIDNQRVTKFLPAHCFITNVHNCMANICVRVFLFTVMAVIFTACGNDVPYRKTTLIEIFDTSFYHSDITPVNNHRFDKPYVINSTVELHEFLDSWHITDYQTPFDPVNCSVIVVQSF